jgi:ferrochelatase
VSGVPHKRRVGVVLFQLGGPDSLAAVQPFLYNLFCDPDILDLPLGGLLRKPLAWWIARSRWEHAAHGYRAIGNRSPIARLTERQAAALERELAPHMDARVVVAMRYWHPLTSTAVEQLRGRTWDEIVLLPLYPQFSMTTTRSSLNEWNRCYQSNGVPVHMVEHYHQHPLLIDAFVERIAQSLSHFRRPPATSSQDVHLIFSAHSVPVSFIRRGDPYQRQIEESTRLVVERGAAQFAAAGRAADWPAAHTLCYQSKVGRQDWLVPSLVETVERLAGAGTRRMLVVPISFVSEHIETLHEINEEARELALRHGVRQFEMVPALGDSPKFVAALAQLVWEAIGSKAERAGTP